MQFAHGLNPLCAVGEPARVRYRRGMKATALCSTCAFGVISGWRKIARTKSSAPAGLDKNIFRAVGKVVSSTMITRRSHFLQGQSFQGIDVCLAVSAR
jgi:hypothetical protein